ncbi:MAG: DUF4097 family beta strand repeat-containing protein [Ignavibacteriaceae bacterium]
MKGIIMVNKHLFALLFVTLFSYLFLGAASSGAITFADDLKVLHEKTFPINPGKQLKVKTPTGDVEVTYWDESKVYIKILGDDDAEERMSFEFNNDDNLVEIIADKDGSLFSWFSGINLKYEIKVPANFNVDVSTSGGDIKLGGVNGTAKLHTSGGDVWAERVEGNLDVSTSGGDIKLICGGTEIVAHTSGGDINLNYFGPNLGIDLSTSGGDIRVELPADFDASMELSTSGGDVSCNLTMNNATKLSGHKIVADLNNGGMEFNAHTSGGDIDVMKK